MRHSSYLWKAVPALARGDVERLLSFVAQAESMGADDPFTPELLVELGRLVEADWIGYNELDCIRRRTLLLTQLPGEHDAAGLDEDAWEILQDHPVCQAHVRGDFRTLKVSDFLNRREFHRMKLYTDWFRPFGVEYELELAIPSPLWHTRTFIFDREAGRDFTERDRLILDLLKPHLVRLWQDANERRQASADVDPVHLTAREREVLQWVARGKTNTDIARLLWLSPATVRKHLENVYAKLGVRTRTAAVARFMGLIDAEGDDAASARG
jgi:DNA-binding CsgD family transcriptional regulator